MYIIYVLAIGLNIITVMYLVYFLITSMFAVARPKIVPKSRPKTKIAVLIAARNEEKVIGKLIDSLTSQKYPNSLYDIYVLPNNCTDNTACESLKHGAQVISVDIPVKSKGEALQYAFSYFNKNHIAHDVYVIFDADNVVHKDFLKRVNDAYVSGIKVAQGYRDSKNPCDTWVSGAFSIYHWINNTFVNGSRNKVGLSSFISGTGFMIASEVIKNHGYDVTTITEDTEFCVLCALNGYKVEYLKDAITYDEQALDFKTSVKQRKRWSYGTLQCLKKYGNLLILKGSAQSLDMTMFLAASIFQLIAVISQTINSTPCSLMFTSISNAAISLGVSYLVSVFIAMITVAINKKKVNIFGILLFPIFILTWIPINIAVLFKKECKWEQITHDRAVKIEEVA